MLSSRIAYLRNKAGLSQAALAKLLGVSPSAVGMYEQGRREPSRDLLIAMAQIFDVSTDYLLTGNLFPNHLRDSLCIGLLSHTDTLPFQPAKHPAGAFSREELAVLVAALLIER